MKKHRSNRAVLLFQVLGQSRPQGNDGNEFFRSGPFSLQYPLHRAGVHRQRFGAGRTAPSVATDQLPQFPRDGAGVVVERVVSQKGDDRGMELHLRRRPAVFPIIYAFFADADCPGDIGLRHVALDAYLADVFADGFRKQ